MKNTSLPNYTSHVLPPVFDEVSSGRPDVASGGCDNVGSASSKVSLPFPSPSTTGSSLSLCVPSDSLFSSSSSSDFSFLGNTSSSVSFFATSEIYNSHVIYSPNAPISTGSKHVLVIYIGFGP
jgi:hypothetical protein